MKKKLTTKLKFKFNPPEEKNVKKLDLNISFEKKEAKKKKIKIIKLKKENNVRDNSTGLF